LRGSRRSTKKETRITPITRINQNGAAILYTSRGRFAEYDVLVAEMPRYLRCGYIDQQMLLAGAWRDALDRVWDSPPPPERPSTNGPKSSPILSVADCRGRKRDSDHTDLTEQNQRKNLTTELTEVTETTKRQPRRLIGSPAGGLMILYISLRA
jgi:hypothetical protein